MFTAHIDKYDKTRRQSVSEHSIGAADKAVCYAEKLGLGKTARLQGMLHDIGKLCFDFNAYITETNNLKRGDIDHAYAGAKYLSELSLQNGSIYAKIIAGYISRTIVSHHGLHDWLRENGKSYFDERIAKDERYAEILKNAEELISNDEIAELLERSAEEFREYHNKIAALANKNTQKYLFYGGLFERLLQSVLVDADRTDTADFMFGRSTEQAVDAEKVWECASRRLCEKYDGFSLKKDKISARRTKIAGDCFAFAERSVGACRLIVPTGGGKTLSSLRFAVEYCRRHGKERIFYVAPFMSILEQNSDVIGEIAGAENFLEHYSDFALSVDDKEELAEYELRTEKWDLPVISTTLVQFLNTIFSDKMPSVRRFHRLSNAVIIIDEVQAIPVKCVNLFNLAVNFLSGICGSAVVLCTATQPALNKTEFPVEFGENMEMNPDYEEDFRIFRRTELVSECRTSSYTYEETADFCADKFAENGDLLVVVNTKNAAAKIYELLKSRFDGETEILHLSTGMCPEHRRTVLRQIRERLKAELPVICVTTQLIEAGVDISFRCVVRSLAGLDNAAQAAGRCNRNGEYPVCAAYIINIGEERLGNLPEIAQRQRAAGAVILGGEYKDLLDVGAMDEYFKLFYNEQGSALSYKTTADDTPTTLVDLLSLNSQRNSFFKRERASELVGTQSFKTAGSLFGVIDDDTENVAVPYNDEAKRLIAELNSGLTLAETAERLRKVQRYVVSVYSNQMGSLAEKNAVFRTKSGIFALNERFYDSHGIGLDLSGGDLETLIF